MRVKHVGRVVATVAWCVFASACASGGGAGSVAQAGKSGCALVDSIGGVPGPIYRDCGVTQRVQVMTVPRFDFTPNMSERCVRAIVDLVVDEKGSAIVSTAHLVRATSSSYGTAVMAAIPSWRFSPASKGGIAVKQLYRLDHGFNVMVVVVRAGQAPPSRSATTGRSAARPNC